MNRPKQDIETLAELARAGDAASTAALWEQVRRFACLVSSRYRELARRCGGVTEDDLGQCAALGVLEAIRLYDRAKGSFLALCALHIRRACLSALGMRGRPRLEHYTCVSLDAPVQGAENVTLADCFADEALYEAMEAVEDREDLRILHDDLMAALARLPEQDGEIIRRHDLEGQTLHAAGVAMGLSVSQTAHRRHTVLARLRKDRRLCERYQPNYWRHKGLAAFRTTFSSVVEDEAVRHLDSERSMTP